MAAIPASSDDRNNDGNHLEEERREGEGTGIPSSLPVRKDSEESAMWEMVVRDQTATLFIAKRLFVLFMVLVAVFLCLATYLTIRDEDMDEERCGEAPLIHVSQGIFNSLEQQMASRLSAAYSLSLLYTSSYVNQWPFVTLPDFNSRTEGLLETTSSSSVIFSPLLTRATHVAWEEYAMAEHAQQCGNGELCSGATTEIFRIENDEVVSADTAATQLAPVWQAHHPTTEISISPKLYDVFSDPALGEALNATMTRRRPAVSRLTQSSQNPSTVLVYPIFDQVLTEAQRNVVGFLLVEFEWEKVLKSAMPFVPEDRLIFILENSCLDQKVRFVSEGGRVKAAETVRQRDMSSLEQQAKILSSSYGFGAFSTNATLASDEDVGTCDYWLRVTRDIESEDPGDDRAVLYAIIVVIAFMLLIAAFLVYDWTMEKRQGFVMDVASRSSHIVETMVPKMPQRPDKWKRNVSGNTASTEPLSSLQINGDTTSQTPHPECSSTATPPTASPPATPPRSSHSCDSPEPDEWETLDGTPTSELEVPLTSPNAVEEFAPTNFECNAKPGPDSSEQEVPTEPIADVFHETTVMYADLVGLGSWSDLHEPAGVFTLLETVYQAMDDLASKFQVFRVSGTNTSKFMAVSGLPEPDETHYATMARFSIACMSHVTRLLKDLETSLGPDISGVTLRMGLHSGPVAAGVIHRRKSSRVQVVGDTVEMAAYMEQSSTPGKTLVSQQTAELLAYAGKAHWLLPRQLDARNEDEPRTFWLDPPQLGRRLSGDARAPSFDRSTAKPQLSDFDSKAVAPNSERTSLSEKDKRLVCWNVDLLFERLIHIMKRRSEKPRGKTVINYTKESTPLGSSVAADDVAEIIVLPDFRPSSGEAPLDKALLQEARQQLQEYVSRIATMYNDVPFHNFEHATHVTLSANKLMGRIVLSDDFKTEEELHNATFGISSDPITHFAVVFAALIHDVGHVGVPNAQLIREKSKFADAFGNRAVAEQYSVHLAWELLMCQRFNKLRSCIYRTTTERERFRQLLINAVLATDIADKEMKLQRNSKWEKAFASDVPAGMSPKELMDLKATVVVEHIIQVSDVAHTMQHWKIYRRWSERLFCEMFLAFRRGRSKMDPSKFWRKGELWFFDNYVVPLARKMDMCGVLGSSGNECLLYAIENRKEWEQKGGLFLEDMLSIMGEEGMTKAKSTAENKSLREC